MWLTVLVWLVGTVAFSHRVAGSVLSVTVHVLRRSVFVPTAAVWTVSYYNDVVYVVLVLVRLLSPYLGLKVHKGWVPAALPNEPNDKFQVSVAWLDLD